jgi:hypothetical protein
VERAPESFIRDYELFRERMEWANAGGIRDGVGRAQAVYSLKNVPSTARRL